MNICLNITGFVHYRFQCNAMLMCPFLFIADGGVAGGEEGSGTSEPVQSHGPSQLPHPHT